MPEISRKNIGIDMEYIGFIEYTELVSASIINRTPLILDNPGSQFARSLNMISEKLLQIVYENKPVLYSSNEDIINLNSYQQGRRRVC